MNRYCLFIGLRSLQAIKYAKDYLTRSEEEKYINRIEFLNQESSYA